MGQKLNITKQYQTPEKFSHYIPLSEQDFSCSLLKKKICSFESLQKAAQKCYKNVGWKKNVMLTKHDEICRLLSLQDQLLNNTYNLSAYYSFYIYEPKKRWIQATTLRDRIFQRSLCDNYLYKEITRHFVYENVSCQIGKGTDFGRKLLKSGLIALYNKIGPNDLQTKGFILKCDIKHFFESINHEELWKIIQKYVRDPWARNEVLRIINSYKKGIGLGSQITQLLALTMLSPLDHFIKEELKIKYYVRYMDDFVLLHEDRQYLQYCRQKIRDFLIQYKLELNLSKTQIFHITQSVKFLGFLFKVKTNGHVVERLPPNKISKERRKLKRQMEYFLEHECLDYDLCLAAYQSWRAHIRLGTNYSIEIKMNEYFNNLYEQMIQKKGEYYHMFRNYICYKKYNGPDIENNYIQVEKGRLSVCYLNYLVVWSDYKTQHTICYNKSEVAFSHFCQNDDGKGEYRGQLILKIQDYLEPIPVDLKLGESIGEGCVNLSKITEQNIKKQKAILAILNDEKLIELHFFKNAPGLIWDYNFYNASISDLNYIIKIIEGVFNHE